MIRLWALLLAMTVGTAFAVTNTAVIVSAPRLDDLDLMTVDAAADVSVIDRSDVEESGAASVPELLQKEANVLVRSTTGNGQDGQISMRGFGENSHVRVLVLVDGHKINSPDMGGIDWQRIPVSNIERVEIIRGGQNVLYGNHAMSGVIKITTRRSEGAAVRAGVTMGSFDYRSARAEVDWTAGDADLRVGVNTYAYEGFRSNSASRASSVNASCGYYLNDSDLLTVRTSFGRNRAELPGPLTYDEMMDDPTQSVLYDGFTEEWNLLGAVLYEMERDWGAGRVSSGVSYRDREVNMIRYDNYTDTALLGFSLGPRARFGDADSFFMTGADVFYDDLGVQRYLTGDRDIELAHGDFGRITAAPYLFAQKTVQEKTIFSSGVRVEYAGTDNHYTQYVENQLSPTQENPFGGPPLPNPFYKNPPDVQEDLSYDGYVENFGWAAELSATRHFNDKLSIWTGWDRVYRYPTLDESAAYQGYPLADPLNENLDPETGHNFEVGTLFKGHQWTWSLTAYCMLMDNEIVYDADLRLNRNQGETRRLGLDAEVTYDRKWYGLSSRWSCADARIAGGSNEGNRIPLVPWAYGTSSVWFELIPEIRFTLLHTFVSGQYQGNDEANELRMMDPYNLLSFRMNVAMGNHADLILSADNLTDETYASVAYSGSSYYPGAGRSYRVGLEMEF